MKSTLELRNNGRSLPMRINIIKFPGGEINVSVPVMLLQSSVTITVWLKDSDGIMALSQLKSILDDHGVKEVTLFMGYVPYARQDRVCNKGESLSIKVFTSIINTLNFCKVIILDPHSDVTTALLDRVHVIDKAELFEYMTDTFDCFVAPDAGATKEVQKLSAAKGVEFIQGTKERDTNTGALSGFSYYGHVEGKNLLIVDDLCDGGGTFLGLAEALSYGNPASISLYVTHGMFTKGVETVKEHFKTIYTTNSFNKDIELNSNINCIYAI